MTRTYQEQVLIMSEGGLLVVTHDFGVLFMGGLKNLEWSSNARRWSWSLGRDEAPDIDKPG